MESCTNCGAEATAERVCTNCGLASDEREFVLEPRRSHELDEPNREASRVRADRSTPVNLALHDFGLGSRFDGSGVSGDVEKCELFDRMETLNEGEPDESNRSLRAAMCSVDALGELLDLPGHVERRVAYLYRKAQEEGLTQQRDLRAVLGALIVIATREAGIPRARKEVLDEVNRLPSMHPQLGRHYERGGRSVSRGELREFEQDIKKSLGLDIPTPKPEQYVPRFATAIGLEMADMILAVRICRFVDTDEVSRDPKLAAAAVLYSVAKKKVTVKGISEKLPVGYTERLYTMADKVKDLIHDQVYNPEVKVESSERLNPFERRMDELMAKYDSEKIGEASEILYELLKRERVLPTKNPATKEILKLAATDLLLEKDRRNEFGNAAYR